MDKNEYWIVIWFLMLESQSPKTNIWLQLTVYGFHLMVLWKSGQGRFNDIECGMESYALLTCSEDFHFKLVTCDET